MKESAIQRVRRTQTGSKYVAEIIQDFCAEEGKKRYSVFDQLKLENQKQKVGMSTKLGMRNANLHKGRYFITLTVKILLFLLRFPLPFHFSLSFSLRIVRLARGEILHCKINNEQTRCRFLKRRHTSKIFKYNLNRPKSNIWITEVYQLDKLKYARRRKQTRYKL